MKMWRASLPPSWVAVRRPDQRKVVRAGLPACSQMGMDVVDENRRMLRRRWQSARRPHLGARRQSPGHLPLVWRLTATPRRGRDALPTSSWSGPRRSTRWPPRGLVVTYESAGILNFAFGSIGLLARSSSTGAHHARLEPGPRRRGRCSLSRRSSGFVLYLAVFRFLRTRTTLINHRRPASVSPSPCPRSRSSCSGSHHHPGGRARSSTGEVLAVFGATVDMNQLITTVPRGRRRRWYSACGSPTSGEGAGRW